MKVKATGKFKMDNVYPQELNGIIPEEGFEFELSEERAKLLKAKGYVDFAQEVETATKKVKTQKAVKKTTKKTK